MFFFYSFSLKTLNARSKLWANFIVGDKSPQFEVMSRCDGTKLKRIAPSTLPSLGISFTSSSLKSYVLSHMLSLFRCNGSHIIVHICVMAVRRLKVTSSESSQRLNQVQATKQKSNIIN